MARPDPPPYYPEEHYLQEPVNGGGRVCFWIAAGSAWAVWGLAVTASAHDEWVRQRLGPTAATEFGPGDSNVLDNCDDIYFGDLHDEFESVCALFHGFTWMQYIATVMCSIAVAALALAAFLPTVVGCCAWVKSLAVTGGVFMAGFVVCQFLSVLLVYIYVEEAEKLANKAFNGLQTTFGDSVEAEFEFSTTFWIAGVGLVLGFFTSVSLCACCCNAGDGPLYCGCCGDNEGNTKRDRITYHV